MRAISVVMLTAVVATGCHGSRVPGSPFAGASLLAPLSEMEEAHDALLRADLARTDSSARLGIARGLAANFTSDVVYLRGGLPIVRGRSAVQAIVSAESLAGPVTVRWQPVRAEVSRDGPVAITRHGMATTDLLCAQTLEVFAAAFGAEAGDLALTVLATGGVYVAGGIAPAILPRLREGPFLAAFRDKGRLGDMLTKIPVHVVMNTNVGLIGAAVAATDPGMLAGAATPAQPLSHETSGTP